MSLRAMLGCLVFPDVPGPAVCACSDVCPAHDRKQLPSDCECAQLCHCS